MSLWVGLVERKPLLGMFGRKVLLQVGLVEGASLLEMVGRGVLLKVGLIEVESPLSGKVLLRVELAERGPLQETVGRAVLLQVGLVEGELLPIVLGREVWLQYISGYKLEYFTSPNHAALSPTDLQHENFNWCLNQHAKYSYIITFQHATVIKLVIKK